VRYFAARHGAHDGRVRALVADSPLVDLYRYFEAFLGPEVFRMHRDIRPEDVAGIPKTSCRPRWCGDRRGLSSFRVASLQAWKEQLRSYRLESALSAVSCPSLALVGLREGPEVLRQADEFTTGVSGPVTTYRFSPDDGADAALSGQQPSFCLAGRLRRLDELVPLP